MKIFTVPFKPARIYQGKKGWYVYYHYLNPSTGKFKMFKDRSGINYLKDLRLRKKAAENLRDSYNERLNAGWSPYGETVLQENEEYDNLRFLPGIKALEELYKLKKTTLKRRTWQSYKYSLDILSRYLIGRNLQHLALVNINKRTLVQMFDLMQSKGKHGNKSINNHAANLGVLFNMAVKRELIVKSPLAGYEKLPEESGKNFPFTDKQKADLKKYILKHDPDLWLFVKSIYHLFVRPLELLQVQISHVDLRTNQIIIHSSIGKNKKQLSVAIPESFIDEIKALNLEQYPGDWYLFGYDLKPGPKQYHRNAVSKRHTVALRACGITDPDYTMYGWKHTGNVDAFLAGVDAYDIMRQNRHHSLEQTMKYLRSLGLRPNVGFSKKAPKL